MAIFGFHAVISLITCLLCSKFYIYPTLFTFLITDGLFRYVAPSNNDLRALMPASKEKANTRTRRRKWEEEETNGFMVPKQSRFQLLYVPVNWSDLTNYNMFQSLFWICLTIPISLVAYTVSELYVYYLPNANEFNFSIVLLLLAVGFVLQVHAAMTAWYLNNEAERSFIISIGALYFLFSCIFALAGHRFFDVQMLEAYEKLGNNIEKFVDSLDVFNNGTSVSHYRPNNPLMLYISLSIFFSMLSAMLVFPNFRYASMYLKALEIDGRVKRAFDHISFLLPAFILVFYSNPVKFQVIHGRRKLMTESQLDIFRIYLVIIWIISKIIARKSHLQAHLNMAYDKLASLASESGSIKNYVIQRMVLQYYQYLNFAALQYLGPPLLALLFSLLLKTTGNLSWVGADFSAEDLSMKTLGPLRYILDAAICKAFFSFLLLATLLINFSLSLMGVVYHSYIVSK